MTPAPLITRVCISGMEKKKKKSHFQKIILINASTFPYSNLLKIMASYWEKNVEYTDTMNNMTN